jgi:sulfur relay (sulfurtransferase) DsrC/TusE family protein
MNDVRGNRQDLLELVLEELPYKCTDAANTSMSSTHRKVIVDPREFYHVCTTSAGIIMVLRVLTHIVDVSSCAEVLHA